MKRLFFFLTFCAVSLCASASNRYVSPTGDDGDGKSWEHAVHTIAQAIWHVGAGDTMFIAEGVYNEAISAQPGAIYLGGYNAETGERDPELYESVLDGTGIKYLFIKYDADPDQRIVVDGLVFQNANHSDWGGTLYMRGNMTVNNCVFRNCVNGSKSGGIFLDMVNGTGAQAIISNCLFENCSNAVVDQAAAISCEETNLNALVENCIIRGCTGDVMIYSKAGMTVRNCVVYNNHSNKNGCLYGDGTFINNTICNNTGVEARYAGARVEGKVVNCVFWGNTAPNAPNVNYVGSSGGSSNNIADAGSGITLGLATDNSDVNGPNFLNPTTFVGVPSNNLEKDAMREADFSITDASTALLDAGTATGAPATDINGVARPKGAGYDIGAYEYDPDAVKIAVTGVNIIQDTIRIILGESGSLIYEVLPADASNKRVTWSIDDATVAQIKNGKVTGLKVDTTFARVTTQDGNFTDFAVVIIKPIPPKFYPQEVLQADADYQIEDYSIPSFIPFLVAKEEARIDSLEGRDNPDIALIDGKLAVMRTRINELQPKETPYNQIATVNGDPATHMGFCWFTNGGINDGVVQLVPIVNASADDFAGEGLIELTANTSDAILHYTPIQASESPKYDICKAAGLPRNTMFNYVSHKALADNLTPGTQYSWRVGFDGHWSEIGHFVTKDAEQGDFSFIYMTDSHIQDAEYIEQAHRCAQVVAQRETDVKFCLFPGDFVDTGGETNSEWQWERWFEGSMRPMLNAMTVVPTDGNHDDSPSLNYDYHFNTDWGFANGASVKPQFKGITYSFVYGDVLFLVYSLQDWWRESGAKEEIMHSNYITNDIRNWFLDQIEAHPEAKYRVTLSHKNVFSGAGHHEDDECTLLRTLMTPIMKECKIDLAIQGHDHCYEVIGPVNPDTWTVIPNSVNDTVRLYPEMKKKYDRSSNATGLEGGTFTTDDGTLYFIGATCGRKRYEPDSRADMEASYTTDPSILYDGKHHNVNNLFDLFTSKFGQPGSPSYTRFNVTSEGIEAVTYYLDDNDVPQVYNTIRIKHGYPESTEAISNKMTADGCEKFIRDGQLYISKNGMIYNVIGQKIAQ